LHRTAQPPVNSILQERYFPGKKGKHLKLFSRTGKTTADVKNAPKTASGAKPGIPEAAQGIQTEPRTDPKEVTLTTFIIITVNKNIKNT